MLAMHGLLRPVTMERQAANGSKHWGILVQWLDCAKTQQRNMSLSFFVMRSEQFSTIVRRTFWWIWACYLDANWMTSHSDECMKILQWIGLSCESCYLAKSRWHMITIGEQFSFFFSDSLDLDAPPCKCSLDFGHMTYPNLAHLLDASGPRIMEYQLTTPKDKFDARFRQKEAKPIDFEKEGLAYRALVNHCAWNLEPQNLKSCRAAWG